MNSARGNDLIPKNKKNHESEFAMNFEKVRLYFLTHPDKDRKYLGLFVNTHFQKWADGAKSINDIIAQIKADSFPGVSAKSFKLVEAELRALFPEGQRSDPIAFLNALKTTFLERGML